MNTPRILYYLFALCIMNVIPACSQVSTSNVQLSTQLITDQLTHPTAFAQPADNSGRLFVCEQEGRIRIIQNGKLLPAAFLDISGEVVKQGGYDERGLLGLAFHPNFVKNGKFYVYCSVPVARGSRTDHQSMVREYTVSSQNVNLADKSTVKNILAFDEPQSNHNGGDLKFGHDGYLYITAGDGGGQNDEHGKYGNGQNMSTLLGKILRIDINHSPYSIPKDNPFVNTAGARPEIYAYGFRNPWRISFDRSTGQLFAGDVGQDSYEEVDMVTKGGNYGWRVWEGLHPKYPKDPPAKNPLKPIAEYSHREGISVTGGFVYRGKQIPELSGQYVFADWSGPVWSLKKTDDQQWSREKLSISHTAGYWQVYSFGEDQSGELYVLAILLSSDKGALLKITGK